MVWGPTPEIPGASTMTKTVKTWIIMLDCSNVSPIFHGELNCLTNIS